MKKRFNFVIYLMFVLLTCLLTACGHEHVWGEWETLQEATCTTEGSKEHTCECGKTETVTIPKNNHSFGEWKQDKPCDFYEYIRCTDCGEAKESRVAEKRHNYDDTGYCLECKEKVHYTVEEVRQIICINQCTLGEYNNESLIDLRIVWTNLSDKEIDETIFSVVAKWKDEEDVMQVSNKNNVKPGETVGSSSYWETLWPTGMSDEKVTAVKIIYTDGSIVLINGESIEYTRKGYGDVRLDGVIYSLSNDAKSYVANGSYQSDIVIHSSVNNKPVTKIEDRGFYQKESLKSVVIEEGITIIGDYAFFNCVNLQNITIPTSVMKIGWDAFSGTVWERCQSDGLLYISKVLYKYIGKIPDGTTIRVPEGIVSVSSGAFVGQAEWGYTDKGLTAIYLPSTLVDISRNAFLGCDALSIIEIAKANSKYHSSGNCIIETQSKTLLFGCKNSTIPNDNSVQIIDQRAFYDCYYLTEINIPDSVKYIGEYAFYSCNNLLRVTIGSGVVDIGNSAFSQCQKLQFVTMGSNVERIGEKAFYECYALTSITLSSSLKRIEKEAFHSANLKTMYLGNKVEYFGENAFAFCDFGDIYYDGTKAEWVAIEKGKSWNAYWLTYVIHCNNGDTK